MIDREIKLEEILKGIVPVEREWIIKTRKCTAQMVMLPREAGGASLLLPLINFDQASKVDFTHF